MAGSDASAYLSAVKWGDEGYYFKEFTQKFALPQVAKIIKGQYLNLGVPSLPSPSLNQIVFLASAGKRIKLAAQCVRFKEGRRVVPVGPKLAIPDNYEGWFEILSEDGRAVRCIESVAELAKRFPETCLVRENVKGYVCKSDDADSVTEKTRTIAAGETLVLLGEVLGAPIRGKSSSGRFLRCFTSKGETVFLSLDQRGKFSPIAGEENISGVHSIKNLLTKRFPLMVRLVHGKPPMGLKSNSQFTSEMRLYSLFEEECIMALPLLKDSNIVALPLTAPLKLQAPKNAEVLVKLREYARLTDRCKMMMSEISDRIQVFDITLSKELRNELKGSGGGHNFLPNQRHRRNHPLLIKRSISDPNGGGGGKNGRNSPAVLDRENSAPAGENVDPMGKSDVDDRCYDEIDQIYDYVRGFAPLPDKIKSDFADPEDEEEAAVPSGSPTASIPPATPPHSTPIDADEENGKPEPPPIETIPVRKLSMGVVEPVAAIPQKITVSIINRTPPPRSSKDFERESMHEHIYEKVGRRASEDASLMTKSNHEAQHRKPVRSNSAGKIYFPNTAANLISNGNKLFIKSPAQQRNNSHKPRLYRSSKSSPMLKDAPPQKTTRTNKTCRSSRSLTTSPLFHIRYKSLTNLAVDFSTLDSSNSGGQTSSGSGGSKECKEQLRRKTPRLLRPKSLTNLFWDSNHVVENCNKYNLLQNELVNCRVDPVRKNAGMLLEVGANGKPVNSSQSKRIGTLYL